MATDPHAGQGRSRADIARGPGALRRFMLLGMASISYPGTEAEQLLLAPQDLRTADPSFATEIYNGHFGLAGSLVELNSQSPFEIAPPSEGWARELYGFGWLRHLRVAGSELSREQAKALLGDFLRLHKTVRGLAWQPEVVGRRSSPGCPTPWSCSMPATRNPTRPSSIRSRRISAISRRATVTPLTARRARVAHGARLCRTLHRRAAGGGRALSEAVLQGARPSDHGGRRAYLAEPSGAGRPPARSPAAQAMLHGARPRAAEAALRRHRSRHAHGPLLPPRRRHHGALQWRRRDRDRLACHRARL